MDQVADKKETSIEELQKSLKISNDQIIYLIQRMKSLEERMRVFEEYFDKY